MPTTAGLMSTIFEAWKFEFLSSFVMTILKALGAERQSCIEAQS
jgi:hypothetical protein